MSKKEIRYAILLVLIVVLYASVREAGRQMVARPYPQTEGELQIPGLQDKVVVQRDEFGVPHIYAQNLDDLYLAQGYVHSQDRFWQMEFWRHIGQGRVSEIVGEAGLDSDKFIRTAGWPRIAADTIELFEAESSEYTGILNAYSAGVNAYLQQQNGNISYNYTIMGWTNGEWELEPWEPLHSVSWGVVMAHDLSGNYESELERMELTELLGEEMVSELYPPYPADWPVIVPSDLMGQTGPTDQAAAISPATTIGNLADNLIGRPPENGFAFGSQPFVGSNNWVISGKHTETSAPLLANDPHLAIQMPSIWYEVGLHAPGLDVVGFSFAGVPGVVVGHNENIAWGVTNLGPDVQDLFIEKTNPDNPYQYEFQGEMVDMEVYEETIKVNGGDPVSLTVRRTHHGPIISDIMKDVDLALSFQWTASQPSRVLQSVILLNQAENYDDFREALSYWDVPGQNFVYGDIEGNIAYQATGRIPIRKNGIGLVPVPGWDGEYEWEGFIPYEEMPRIYNPPSGYIVTANHAVVDQNYPYFIEYNWASGNRARRIEQMIDEQIAAGGLGITTADIAAMQTDSYSLTAEDWVPYLADLDLPANNGEIQASVQLLQEWDYQERRDSVAASVFEIFYWYLLQETLGDELGEEGSDLYLGHGLSTRVLMNRLAQDETNAWWDDVNTAELETRDDILARSMTNAVSWLAQNHGRDVSGWTWGQLHQATFRSAPLGQSGIGLLESHVNRGPFPTDGGEGIVNAIAWDWDEPARVNWHPSMRMIVDLGDFDQSLTIMPTGQSGHPGHDHYDDMIRLWIEGELHPMWYSRTAVDANTTETLILSPPDQE